MYHVFRQPKVLPPLKISTNRIHRMISLGLDVNEEDVSSACADAPAPLECASTSGMDEIA
jgi:hypothetical protein